MNICTIVARDYLAHARVLAESFREHHPEDKCIVCVIDDREGTVGGEPFEVVRVEELGVPKLRDLAVEHDAAGLADAVKPWFFGFLLGRDEGIVVYVDADVRVYGPLDEAVVGPAKEHGILLAARLTDPIPPDGEKPDERDLLSIGLHDPGFLALSAGEHADRFLGWWREGVLADLSEEKPRHTLIDGKWEWVKRRPLFNDRKWVDLVPGMFPGAGTLRDPGCDVGYWNLHARKLGKDGASYTVDGEPLRFLHFSGFRPELPHWLSKYATRVKVSGSPVLTELCKDYASSLKGHGYDEAIETPYGYGELPNGIPYNTTVRLVHEKALEEGEDFGDVFEPGGAEALLRWMNAPAEKGGRHGVTRYLYLGIYKERPDVQRVHKDLDGKNGPGFVRWVHKHGRDAYDMPDELMPPGGSEEAPKAGRGASRGGGKKPAKIDGVNVAGYLGTGIGLGEAARGYVSALKAADIPVATTVSRVGIPVAAEFHNTGDGVGRGARVAKPGAVEDSSPYSTNLVCVNAEQFPAFREQVGEKYFDGRRTIAVWAWEVNSFPEKWVSSFRFVDEIWVYTNYIAEILGRISPVPVVVVPPPVEAPKPGDAKPDLGIPEGFTFLFMFDFYSVPQRKNPLGLIEAFKRAFEPGEGPQLVIKSIHGAQLPEFLEQLRVAAMDHPDIYVVDEYVSLKEKQALMANCDCYVSLHRSEGFGLTPAEAMSLGKPVISTGYSGNLDFMNTANSYLVDYEMTKVGEGVAVYPADGDWADPDLDHAASLMRHVWQNQDEARKKGEIARRDVERLLSPKAVGKVARTRLERLAEAGELSPPSNGAPPARGGGKGGGRGEGPGKARDQLQLARELLRKGPAAGAQSRLGGAGKFARRLVLRGMRPFTFYQRQLDTAIIGAIQQAEQTVQAATSKLTRRLEQVESQAHARAEDVSARVADLTARLAEAAGELASTKTIVGVDRERISYVDKEGRKVLGFENADDASSKTDTYRTFEDIFRGGEDLIKQRQEWYLGLLNGRSWVLDVGCGRGELLDLLRDRGIESRGVDGDKGMVEHCKAKGHDVVLDDVNSYLRKQKDGSVPAIFAAQFIEHLPHEALVEFIHLSCAKLEPGGLLIAETVNPHSPLALKAFWTDLTHKSPVFPEVALALCRIAGFHSARVVFPNRSDDLDEELFTSLDYAVLAHKGAEANGSSGAVGVENSAPPDGKASEESKV